MPGLTAAAADASREWARQSVALQKRVAALERDIGTFYTTKSDLNDTASSLQESERQDAQARREELGKIRKQLRARRALLRQIKDRVTALAAGLAAPQDLQALMEQLETMLSSFRRGMRTEFEALAAQERTLTRELQAAATRFEDWANPSAANTGTADDAADDASSSRAGGGSRQAEQQPRRRSNTALNGGSAGGGTERDAAQRIDAIIEGEGGGTGGWPRHHHDTFLRLWTQVNRGDPCVTKEPLEARRAKVAALLSRAALALVERDSSEVEAHFAWYVRHLEYSRQKRELVAAWRERRAHARAAAEEAQEAADDVAAATDAAGEATRRADAQREKQRLSVRAWQERRAAEAAEAAAAAARASATAEAAQKQAGRAEQQRRRREVAAYRAERVREEARLETARRMMSTESRRMSAGDVAERAARDVEAARARRAALDRAAQQKKEREEALLRGGGGAARWERAVRPDPERLLGPTAASRAAAVTAEEVAWRGEERSRAGAHEARIALSSRDVRGVGRAVPAWLKGAV